MTRAAAWIAIAAGVAAATLLFTAYASIHEAASTPTGKVTVHTAFVNQSGGTFFNATLHLDNATALTALDEAARKGNFSYHVTYYPGFGSRAAGAFVDMVADEWAEPGQPDGWIYRIHRDGTWHVPDRSAAIYPLEDGDTLVWAWSAAWDGA